MTPGIYYFYEYQADKKIRNVGFLKLTQTFQSCHLQISIRQIPAASQEKLPLSMFFSRKTNPEKKLWQNFPHKISVYPVVSHFQKLTFHRI